MRARGPAERGGTSAPCDGDRARARVARPQPSFSPPHLLTKPLQLSTTTLSKQTGVVSGATAILSSVNGLTPHMAGAIDVMVVEQPDGSLRCSPFYGEEKRRREGAAA